VSGLDNYLAGDGIADDAIWTQPPWQWVEPPSGSDIRAASLSV